MTVVTLPPRMQAPARVVDTPAYAELAVTSNFSFLRGASSPEELVRQAIALKLRGVGIADRNSVAGVVRAHVVVREMRRSGDAALPADFHVAVGARLTFDDGRTPDILAYPRDRAAVGRVTRFLSRGKLRGGKGECLLGQPALLDPADGMHLIVMPPARIEPDALVALLVRLRQADS